MENEIFDVIVIGGGPAGYTAALYAARAGFSVVVLEKLAPGGQMGTTDVIDNYPGFPEGINGYELAEKMKQGAARFGVKTKLAAVTAVELNGEIKKITTPKETYSAKTVIIATGASPRELGLPNENELRGKGVSYCATCDGMFYRGKTVAVVGGGNTAVSDALYLSRLCEKVYLIHRRDALRASKVYLDPLKDAGNIEFVWNSEVKEIFGDPKVSGVRVKNKMTNDETDLPCAGVFIAVGHTPETELFRGILDMDESGYIIADETAGTNIPGVFAAGDVRTKALRQVVTAAADGANAARAVEEYLNV